MKHPTVQAAEASFCRWGMLSSCPQALQMVCPAAVGAPGYHRTVKWDQYWLKLRVNTLSQEHPKDKTT